MGCLLFLFWATLAIYVEVKKDSLLEQARTEINSRIGGTLRIGHADISLFRHFPAVTLSLSDVSLRDSAWQRHRHDLLQAERVYISFSPFRSLFHRRVELGTVFIENGSLYFYTDSTGYSNTYLLSGHGSGGSSASFRVIRVFGGFQVSGAFRQIRLGDRASEGRLVRCPLGDGKTGPT